MAPAPQKKQKHSSKHPPKTISQTSSTTHNTFREALTAFDLKQSCLLTHFSASAHVLCTPGANEHWDTKRSSWPGTKPTNKQCTATERAKGSDRGKHEGGYLTPPEHQGEPSLLPALSSCTCRGHAEFSVDAVSMELTQSPPEYTSLPKFSHPLNPWTEEEDDKAWLCLLFFPGGQFWVLFRKAPQSLGTRFLWQRSTWQYISVQIPYSRSLGSHPRGPMCARASSHRAHFYFRLRAGLNPYKDVTHQWQLS